MATTKQTAFQYPISWIIILVELEKNIQQRIAPIRNNYSTYLPDVAENKLFCPQLVSKK